MNNLHLILRIAKDRIFHGAVVVCSAVVILPLFLIIYYIARKGIASIDWQFLTGMPRPIGEPGGGIANALVGSAMLIAGASIMAVPVGVFVGVYLAENRTSKTAAIVRLCVEILQGIPSIVIGIIAYAWVVVPMGSFSAFSGSIALAIMMLPVIARATEETLKMIPESIREASLALGVSYVRTVIKVIMPAGLTGILTGIIVSVARIAGETAPLLFTAFGSPYFTANFLRPVDSLPHIIFNYATSPYPEWHAKAWGAAFVLVTVVLGLNLTAKIVTRRWKVQF